MSPALSYGPAYLGLFASLWLAFACNAFLDIVYGSFGTEVLLAALVFGGTLRIGWKQRSSSDESGRRWQKRVAVAGLLLTIVVFLPMYGLPRAGVYLLCMLQAALNCVTTTRRHLYIGLLVSVVLVMFATSHYRADWTMLFYLVPYVTAAVFTLVAEQVSRRATQVREASLGRTGSAGQGLAIAAASAAILSAALGLYLVTPQVFLPQLLWRYGQPGNVVPGNAARQNSGPGSGGESRRATPGVGSGQNSPIGQGEQESAGVPSAAGDGQAGTPDHSPDASPPQPPAGAGWPGSEEMRQAARRPGIPHWQSSAIAGAADVAESIEAATAPFRNDLQSLWNDFMDWLREHATSLKTGLLIGLLLGVMAGFALLLREIRPASWLRTRVDYLLLGVFAWHAVGRRGASQYFRAIERLFDLLDRPRVAQHNVREFLRATAPFGAGAKCELLRIADIFERCRYGPYEATDSQLREMRRLYRAVFRSM